MLEAARGALLGTFVGDALGMPFEGSPADAIPVHVEMEEARLGRGTYTDDTQMAIALAESLVACGEVDEQHLAQTFAEHFDADRGYGPGTASVVAAWRKGAPALEPARNLFDGAGSAGNGAAMRVAPVGVRFAGDPTRCEEQARRQARLTHTHPLGEEGAAVQAAAVAAAARGDDPLAAARAAARTPEFAVALDAAGRLARGAAPAEVAEALGADVTALGAVPVALTAALAEDSFEAAVTFAVCCGGDTDTTAAMAGAIAGARYGDGAIPPRWLDALEDGPRGRRHVERLATALVGADRVPPP